MFSQFFFLILNLTHNYNLNMIKLKFLLFFSAVILLFTGCGKELPVEEDLSGESYPLLNQDSVEVRFPDIIEGKTAVVGYIFTNCPDICPLTTNNMRLVQEKVNAAGVEGVEFVSISFDPKVDKPSVLSSFAEVRNLDTSNWTFLTGDKKIIDSLMGRLKIVAVPGDTSVTSSGEEYVYFIHTDRISLFDSENRLRKNYLGSKAPIDEVVEDVKTLAD